MMQAMVTNRVAVAVIVIPDSAIYHESLLKMWPETAMIIY